MKRSLKAKVIAAVLLVSTVVAGIAVLVSYRIYAGTMDAHYQTLTMNLAKTASSLAEVGDVKTVTDTVMQTYRNQCAPDGTAPDFDSFAPSDWEQYYGPFQTVFETESYQNLMDVLSKIRNDNRAKSVYLCFMDEQTGKAVYLIDASPGEDACQPGTCDAIEDGNLKLMRQGIYDFPAYITNYEEYGWLCSASAGVTDADGKVIANAYVDISMNDVMQERHNFLLRLILFLAGATALLTVLLALGMTRTVVRPINQLARAADSFVSEKQQGEEGGSAISKLDIKTGDEIENLSQSIRKMEQDINTYIHDLTSMTAERERLSAELDVAKHIQASMLPCIFPPFPERLEFDIYASMTPAKEVGGDFYDFFLVDDDHLALVMADVSGKGVPAALFMVIAKTLLKNAAQLKLSPKEVLEKVNNQLCENNDAQMFVTVWLGVYEISTGKLIAANAGHEYPALKRRNGSYELLHDKHGFVLAGMENVRYKEYEFQLEVGDTLFVYTDGVPEATDAQNTLYGTDRMLDVLSRNRSACLKDLLAEVKRDIDGFVGEAPQFDDITMLALQRKEEL